MITKYFTYIFIVFGLLTVVSACVTQPNVNVCATERNLTETGKWSLDDFSELKDLCLDRDAAHIANYLQNRNYPDVNSVRGETLETREKSQTWLIHNYAETLVTRGIDFPSLSKAAGRDENALSLVDRFFNRSASRLGSSLCFSDYLALSEIAIIAKVGDPLPKVSNSWSGPEAFYLDVKKSLNNVMPLGSLALINARSPHDTRLETGKECVFFISPTLTKYRKSASLFGRRPKEEWSGNVMEKAFIPYCTQDGNIFTAERIYGNSENLTRQEILDFSNQE